MATYKCINKNLLQELPWSNRSNRREFWFVKDIIDTISFIIIIILCDGKRLYRLLWFCIQLGEWFRFWKRNFSISLNNRDFFNFFSNDFFFNRDAIDGGRVGDNG